MANSGNVNENDRLVELKGSGYEIVKGEPDIRGWEVRDVQGRTVGKVDELIFDKESQKVRYVVLNLKGNLLNLKSRKVLIPIGLAKLDENRDEVIFPDVTAVHLTELYEYKKGPITYDDEDGVRTVFSGIGSFSAEPGAGSSNLSSSGDRRDFYQHSHFDDNQLHRKRPDTHTSVGDTDVHRADTSAGLRTFEEGTVEFTEKKEVPIVTKEARVVEEVSVKKDLEERDAVVKDTVKRTEVDIERRDKDDRPL